MTRTSLEIVQGVYTALDRADLPALLALLDQDLEWTEAERFPYYSGTWRAPQMVVDNLLVPLARDWDPFTVTAEDFLVAGDRVVSFGFYAGRYKATGRSMQARFAHHWTVRGERIAKFDMYVDTVKVREAMQAERVGGVNP